MAAENLPPVSYELVMSSFQLRIAPRSSLQSTLHVHARGPRALGRLGTGLFCALALAGCSDLRRKSLRGAGPPALARHEKPAKRSSLPAPSAPEDLGRREKRAPRGKEPSPSRAARRGSPSFAYPFAANARSRRSLISAFPPPPGARRVRVGKRSFGAYLRYLPLLPAKSPVLSYRGEVVVPGADSRLAGVVDLDIGRADLQQCADAVIRLDGEWRYARGDRNLRYRSASGRWLGLADWRRGQRVGVDPKNPRRLRVRKVTPVRCKSAKCRRRDLRAYFDQVFAWTNTVALARQTKLVSWQDVKPGDFFVQPGNPGHTVLVLDVAETSAGRFALLGQSFMPAQSFHVLRASGGSPWFDISSSRATVKTPFWEAFKRSDLHRFRPTNSSGPRRKR